MPTGALRMFCEKTQLCKFYQAGACTKGRRCGFAHSEGELRAPPDLRRTKLCPRLISTGECDDAACHFAHTKDELHRLKLPGQCGVKTSPEQLRTELAGAACKSAALEGLPFGRSVSKCPTEASFGSEAGASAGFSRATTPDDASLASLSLDLSDGESGSQQPPSDGESGTASGGNYRCDGISKRARASSNKFYKTSMCNFQKEGHCKKGEFCRFAHDARELKRVPDLTCTKMCPQVLAGKRCSLDGCAFAHCQEELRGKQPEPAGLPATRLGGGAADPARAVGGLPRSGAEEASPLVPEAPRLRVKNTFIDVEEPSAWELLPRRARSAPPRLARAAVRPEGVEEEREPEKEEPFPAVCRHRQFCKTWAPAIRSPAWDRQPRQPLALPPRAAAPGVVGVVALAVPRLR